MEGVCLRFYVHENRKHHHVPVYEWLLAQAKKLGIHGGSAFKGIAGYGHHGILHEEHFFELAGELPVEVVFVIDEKDAERLMESIGSENLSLFYVRTPVEFGTTLSR